MMYKCNICGFNHQGEMPDGYHCPLCLSGYDKFTKRSEIKEEFNRKILDDNNQGINRIGEKCINCGMCAKTCNKITELLVDRDIKKLDKKINKNLLKKICFECGSCILTCPTSALTPKYDYQKVLEYIKNPDYTVIALTSPATRVGLGDAFFKKPGEFLEGKMVSALKTLGFDYVFDVTFGADLTSIEEAHEFKTRIETNKLPMFTSCCPSWVRYCEILHPEVIKNLSTCKSPIGMASTVIKEIYVPNELKHNKKTIIVAVTPCTSKKREILNTDTDFVITASELTLMIRENGIIFDRLIDQKFDRVKGSFSGTTYGTNGGVTKSVLRCLYYELTGKDLKEDYYKIEEKEYYKLIKIKINDRIIRCIILSTMSNLERLLNDNIEYDMVEVMFCDGGCISGRGQVVMPVKDRELIKKARTESLNERHKETEKYPYKNDLIEDVYNSYLNAPGSKEAHKYLHTKHEDLSSILKEEI